jgi:hypothetical protein
MLQKNVCGVLGSYKAAFEICCYIIKSALFKSICNKLLLGKLLLFYEIQHFSDEQGPSYNI